MGSIPAVSILILGMVVPSLAGYMEVGYDTQICNRLRTAERFFIIIFLLMYWAVLVVPSLKLDHISYFDGFPANDFNFLYTTQACILGQPAAWILV